MLGSNGLTMQKPRVGILTTFTGSDEAYSLVNVVRTQLSMLLAADYAPVLFAAPTFSGEGVWKRVEIRKLVSPDAKQPDILAALEPQIGDIDVMLCHDITFLAQHHEWGRAVRRLAIDHPHIAWLHWQHSRGDHAPVEVMQHSWWCYPNQGDLAHVAAINSTDEKHVRYIPHPLDFAYLGWPELAVRIAEDYKFPFVDVRAIYPSRLDRQKQLDKLIRLFAGLKRAGKQVSLLFADAYATGEPFLSYKKDLHALAQEQGLEPGEYAFLSERYEECRYATPRPVVKALLEMSNLFVQPSNAETSSLVVLEAALAGCLVVINADFPPIAPLYKKALALPFGSVLHNTEYYRHIKTADGQAQKVLDPQLFWDDRARDTVLPALESQLTIALKKQQLEERWPSRVFRGRLEPLILEAWEATRPAAPAPFVDRRGDPEVTCIITTIDNLPTLQKQIPILLDEVGKIIVVNNGSLDGTAGWLEQLKDQPRIKFINRENKGAGPGRNAGLAMWDADPTPYTLMLDGGILPPRGGVAAMKDYLTRHPNVDVISPEVATCFTTDEAQATYFMTGGIPDERAFQQSCLSGTAYALVRKHAWDKARFSEAGPFGEPGWGVDDNELMYHWDDAGVIHHDWDEALGVKLLRRQSGSFERLFKETGIWPNQYGSVYEKRVVLMFQTWRHLYDPIWRAYGNIARSFVLRGLEHPELGRTCKRLHEENQEVSHEVIVMTEGLGQESLDWLEAHALRWPHGDTTVLNGIVIKRGPENEDTWTGDIIIDKPPRGKEVIDL